MANHLQHPWCVSALINMTMNMTMTAEHTIVFVEHHQNPMDDLAWTHLGARGFGRQLVCPFQGEKLRVSLQGVAGTVIYGGSQSVGQQQQLAFVREELAWIKTCIANNIPTLGICLGGQLIAHALGAKVAPPAPPQCEFGYYRIDPTEPNDGFLNQYLYVTQAHCEAFEIPQGATRLATSEGFANQAFRYRQNVLALQFHPEVTPAIFKRWQQAEWAMYGIPGAQTKQQQDVLLAQHSAAQAVWFRGLLDQLFPATGQP